MDQIAHNYKKENYIKHTVVDHVKKKKKKKKISQTNDNKSTLQQLWNVSSAFSHFFLSIMYDYISHQQLHE